MAKSPFVLTNVGVQPEMREMAAALAERGSLERYLTALSWASDESMVKLMRSPLFPRSLANIGQRRVLPAAITSTHLRRQTVVFDGAFKSLVKTSKSVQRPVELARNRRFDIASARFVRRNRPQVVVCQASSARETLQAANSVGATSILNCSIAHHRWMFEHLRSEALRNPQWAGSLQGHDTDSGLLSLLDEEIELADGILVGSSFVASTFAAQGVENAKLNIVPLGADPSSMGSVMATPSPIRRRADPLRILFVGQLTQRKGLSYLVEAFVSAALPRGSELLFVGRDEYGAGDVLTRSPGVRVVGHMSRRDLGHLMLGSHLFVLPSLSEGFPLSATEAMSLGVPVAVSEYTFAHDVVTNGIDGFIFPVPDEGRLVEILELAAGDPDLLSAIGARGRERATAFTWENYRRRVAKTLSKWSN